MALDFHQSDFARPLTQFRKEEGDDIKMNYTFWIRVEVVVPPLAQDVEEAQKDQAVDEDQERVQS